MLPGVFPVIIVVTIMLLSAEDMSRPAMILVACVGMCGFMVYIAVADAPTKPGETKQTILQRFVSGSNDENRNVASTTKQTSFAMDSVTELVHKFRLEFLEAQDSLRMLTQLYRRIRGTEKGAAKAAKEAYDLGLLNYALVFIQKLTVDDKRIIVSADIVNEMLSKKDIRSDICASDHHLKEVMDSLILTLKDLITPPRSATSADDKIETGNDASNALSDEHEYPLLPRPKTIPNKQFPDYGYKLIMAVGLLCMDSQVAQTMLGDRGAIETLVSALQIYGRLSAEVLTWCCWTMINITYDHPPNKRDFYQRGGLVLVIDGLKHHAKSPQVYEQGLGMIINILIPDGHTKMNQAQARQSALACNIFEVLESSQKEFKGNESLQAMSNQIMQILVSDFA